MRQIIDFDFGLTDPTLTEKVGVGFRGGSDLNRYTDDYGQDRRDVSQTVEANIEKLKEIGIKHAVIAARDNETMMGTRVPNEKIAAIKNKYPDIFVFAWAGIDPYKGMQALRDLEYSVNSLGLQGCYLSPWFNRMYVNDKKYYPIYAKCAELGVPVSIHCPASLDSTAYMDYGRPLHIDEVAVDFPELKIVMRHPGFPWTNETISVANRHPNVYIDFSGINPRFVPELVMSMNTILQDKVFFGSAYPLVEPSKAIAWIEQLPLKESVKEKVFYENAARFIGLEK